MSEQPTPETDAAIIDADGAWTFRLKNEMQRLERERDWARELAQELRDALMPFSGLNPSSPRVKAKWPDFVQRAEVALIKAKEVLG